MPPAGSGIGAVEAGVSSGAGFLIVLLALVAALGLFALLRRRQRPEEPPGTGEDPEPVA